MKKKLCVYTCITGDYDNLHELENPEKNIDYYCFTNNKNIKSSTWKIIYIRNDNLDDHHLSRKIKMLGHPIINKQYDISVWMDASIIWKRPISSFVNQYLNDHPFVAFKHSSRNSIQEEAITCLKLQKDNKENILRTLSFFDSEHFPDNIGLCEMTVFIKKHNDPTVIQAMNLWFQMNQEYSKRDQLSFMYVVWKTGLKIDSINLSIWSNDWFTNTRHNSKKTIDSIGLYYGDINNPFILDNYYDIKPKQKHDVCSIRFTPHLDCRIITIILPYIPGLIVKDINIAEPIKQIEPINATGYSDDYIFLLSNCILVLRGIFKKGQSVTLSFQLKQIQYLELIDYAAKNCVDNHTLTKLRNDNKALQNENNLYSQTIENQQSQIESYTQTINSIQNSKSWRLIQRIKRLIPSSKH